MPENWEAAASAVKRRREELGMSVRQAAAEAGMSTTTWLKLEKHAEPVTSAKALQMSQALLWPNDGVKRVAAGEDPASLVDPDQDFQTAAVRTLRDVARTNNELAERLIGAARALNSSSAPPDLVAWVDGVQQWIVELKETPVKPVGPGDEALTESVIEMSKVLQRSSDRAQELLVQLRDLGDKYALAADTGDELHDIDPTKGSTSKPR